jgi:hypothetical protein
MIRGNIEMAARLAASLQMSSPMLEAARNAWSEADARLGSGADHTAVIRWLETQKPKEPAAEPAQHAEGRASPLIPEHAANVRS